LGNNLYQPAIYLCPTVLAAFWVTKPPFKRNTAPWAEIFISFSACAAYCALISFLLVFAQKTSREIGLLT
jgi:hypothetical protein